MKKNLPKILLCGENNENYWSLLENTLASKYPKYSIKHIKSGRTLNSNLKAQNQNIELVVLALGENNRKIIDRYGGNGVGFVVFGEEDIARPRVFYVNKKLHHGRALCSAIKTALNFDKE